MGFLAWGIITAGYGKELGGSGIGCKIGLSFWIEVAQPS
jgi:hypothetical protein